MYAQASAFLRQKPEDGLCIVAVAEEDRESAETCYKALVSFVVRTTGQQWPVVWDFVKSPKTRDRNTVYDKGDSVRPAMMCIV